MYFFFSFVGLLTVNHVYILVLWEFCIKKSANPNVDCAFFIILFNIHYILSRLGLSLSRHQVHDITVLL